MVSAVTFISANKHPYTYANNRYIECARARPHQNANSLGKSFTPESPYERICKIYGLRCSYFVVVVAYSFFHLFTCLLFRGATFNFFFSIIHNISFSSFYLSFSLSTISCSFFVHSLNSSFDAEHTKTHLYASACNFLPLPPHPYKNH